MARFRGPTEKISRRFGVPLFGSSKEFERKPYGPGQHGARNVRKKRSDFAVALGEKQKLRLQYGVMEKQFRRYYEEASHRKGVTGHIMLQLLETRLDNVCYRMGLGNTRRASRQFVSHGHVTVNGRRVNVASYQCKPGDVIKVSENRRSIGLADKMLDLTQAAPIPEWINMDRTHRNGVVVRLPERDEVNPMVNEQLVVELYSR
ncbi:MAG: small subunit ribosomal protein S4 [Verrucomicrobia bacterium]|nr:MAG: small subunit ribosomal protein S4 [Verrucomicrobiota bacterium]